MGSSHHGVIVSVTRVIRSVFLLYNQSTGGALPAIVSELNEPFVIEVTAGSVTLNEDSTCRKSISSRQTLNGNVTTKTETGVCTFYRVDGYNTTLTFEEAPFSTRKEAFLKSR